MTENNRTYLELMIGATEQAIRDGIDPENTAQLDAYNTAQISFMDNRRSFGVARRKRTVRTYVKGIQATARYVRDNNITFDDLREHMPAEWWTQIPPFDKTD